jgi:hypothetical protein
MSGTVSMIGVHTQYVHDGTHTGGFHIFENNT